MVAHEQHHTVAFGQPRVPQALGQAGAAPHPVIESGPRLRAEVDRIALRELALLAQEEMNELHVDRLDSIQFSFYNLI